jgi:hypothetical protein
MFLEILLTRICIYSVIPRSSFVFSFFSFLLSSRVFDAFYVLLLISLKNFRNALVSVSSIVSEHVKPSSRIVACSVSRSISSLFVSSIYCTRNISLFFSINFQRFSLFLGRSIGIVNPEASATFTLL